MGNKTQPSRLSPREARLAREAGIVLAVAAANGGMIGAVLAWWALKFSLESWWSCLVFYGLGTFLGAALVLLVAWPFAMNYMRK
jgi:hypothetical protein